MIIRIAGAGTGPELIDPADFGRFHVDASGATDAEVATALTGSGLGELVDGHAFVDPAGLRSLVGTGADDAWDAGFAKMLAYATSKGWLDASGRIQAHLSRD